MFAPEHRHADTNTVLSGLDQEWFERDCSVSIKSADTLMRKSRFLPFLLCLISTRAPHSMDSLPSCESSTCRDRALASVDRHAAAWHCCHQRPLVSHGLCLHQLNSVTQQAHAIMMCFYLGSFAGLKAINESIILDRYSAGGLKSVHYANNEIMAS